jgi:hypothetical protein
MAQARSITCRNCRTWIEAGDRVKRCPSCGAELDVAPLPDLPPGAGVSEELQGPAFAVEHKPGDDTAPLSEFLAAGAVVAGLVMLIVGAVISSGTLALAGVFVMFVVTGLFAVIGGSLLRTLSRYGTSMWGNYYWRRRNPTRGDRYDDRR